MSREEKIMGKGLLALGGQILYCEDGECMVAAEADGEELAMPTVDGGKRPEHFPLPCGGVTIYESQEEEVGEEGEVLAMPSLQVHRAQNGRYTADDPDLPEEIRGLPAEERAEWAAEFNRSFLRCVEDGEEEHCEAVAFRNATAYLKARR
jgi:hypothetical protein